MAELERSKFIKGIFEHVCFFNSLVILISNFRQLARMWDKNTAMVPLKKVSRQEWRGR